jgi:plastocyanin
MRNNSESMRIALIAAAASLAACGGSKPPEPAAKTAEPVVYFHPDPATAGHLKGRILYRGAKPTKILISMDSDVACAQEHGNKPVEEDIVQVGKDGGLANAFIYIQTGLEGKKFEPVKDPVVLDQHGCQFVPHALGIRAGQAFDLRNSDKVTHNIHPVPKNNREWEQSQPPGSPDAEHKFARAEIMIPVKCNIHQWMHAYIGVVEHPYFAVTGPDGSFDLSNVPPGDYTVAVWHEKLGDQTQPVHLAPSSTQPVEFIYK